MATKISKPKKTNIVVEKKKAPIKNSAEITALIRDINKKFGENAVTLGYSYKKDENGNIPPIDRIHTGSFSLDIALGGGIPVGRFTEISGEYSSTKTTQCLHIIREAQKKGFICALIDAEGTTDEDYLNQLGIDTSQIMYNRTTGMEEALELLLTIQKSGLVQLAVLDSIASLSPNKEKESTMEESVMMGVPQKLLGEYFRKFQMNNNLLEREGKTPFTLIGINQVREKIGAYGDPEYTPGGRAKDFASSVNIRLRKGDWISEGSGENKVVVGQVTKFKITKNKTKNRMVTGEFDFYYTDDNNANVKGGYNDYEKEVVISAVDWGIIERAGAWFQYKDVKVQGAKAMVEYLRQNPDVIEEIREKVLEVSSKIKA